MAEIVQTDESAAFHNRGVIVYTLGLTAGGADASVELRDGDGGTIFATVNAVQDTTEVVSFYGAQVPDGAWLELAGTGAVAFVEFDRA